MQGERAGQDGIAAEMSAEALPAADPRPRRRLIGPAFRAVWLLVMLPVVFALVAALALIGHEITAPSWLRQRLESQVATLMQGGALTFGEIAAIIGADLHPHVVLRDAVLTDRNGEVLARVPQVEITLSPRGLILAREVLPQEITVTGASVALERAADGSVGVALGGAAPAGQAPGLAALLDRFDRLVETPGLAALTEVRIVGLSIGFDDARARRRWTADGGEALLSLDRRETRLTATLPILAGGTDVTTLSLVYESPRGSAEARFSLDVTDVAAADIASQTPGLSWLAVLDAPISASIRSGLDAAGNLAPLNAELHIGAGALAPVPGAAPVGFTAARARLVYDPASATIGFDELSVQSDWGTAMAAGEAGIETGGDGMPQSVVGQFRLQGTQLNPAGLFPAPVTLPETQLDLRLRLAPFAIDIGQIAIAPAADGGSGQILGRAAIAASPEGWRVSADAAIARITVPRLLDLWPPALLDKTREWAAANVLAGEITGLTFGLRLEPGGPPEVAFTHQFRDATIIAVRDQPPITGAAGFVGAGEARYSVSLTAGQVTPPAGGSIDVAGTSFTIADMTQRPHHGLVTLATDSTITAAMSLLDQPPMRYPTLAGLPVDLTAGQAQVTGTIGFPLIDLIPPEAFAYDLTAALSAVDSPRIVPGHRLTATTLTLTAVPGTLTVTGAAAVGGVPVRGTFTADTSPEPAMPHLDAVVQISPAALAEFGVGLPEGMVTGQGEGRLTLDLPPGGPARFALASGLEGLVLALPAVGWRKGAGTAGDFSITGHLGAPPTIDSIAIDAAGLRATGGITLTAGGGLDRARFDRVRLGGWLDAPVTLVGRGTAVPRIELGGGTLDLRHATFGGGGGGTGGGPMTLALDRLQITEGIALTGFRGTFDGANGLTGDFTAAVNGAVPVRGAVVPLNGGSAVRILSDDAGAVIAAAGFLPNAQGGSFDLTLLPTGAEGTWDGSLAVNMLRVRDAPALASLLNAISVVGLLQQMAGQGLVFDEVLADFRIAPDRITVLSSSAVGAGLGISLDGIYTMADNRMDFQGVISPFYLINAVGAVLTRRGEGLIGFNFTLRGPLGQAAVAVNPLSVLTPGMFREIFRRPPPVVE